MAFGLSPRVREEQDPPAQTKNTKIRTTQWS